MNDTINIGLGLILSQIKEMQAMPQNGGWELGWEIDWQGR
jgi:hypothetical protein